jgi:hypothetical protein
MNKAALWGSLKFFDLGSSNVELFHRRVSDLVINRFSIGTWALVFMDLARLFRIWTFDFFTDRISVFLQGNKDLFSCFSRIGFGFSSRKFRIWTIDFSRIGFGFSSRRLLVIHWIGSLTWRWFWFRFSVELGLVRSAFSLF